MHAGADECGWRQYPVPGILRWEPESPDYYFEADVAELIAAREWDQIQAKINDRIFDEIYARGVALLYV